MLLRRSATLASCAALALACSIDDRKVEAAAGGAGAADGSSRATGANEPGPGASVSGAGSTPVACDPAAGCAPEAPAPARAGGCSEGQRRCVQGAPEECSGGAWLTGAPCAGPLSVCLAASGRCVSCEPGARRCTGARVEGCGEDGAWQDLGMPCSDCVPGTADCFGSTGRVCSELGAWVGQTCGGALPVCVPETGTCACSENSCGPRELCAASGRCEPLGPDCPEPAPVGTAEQDLAIVRVRFDGDGSAEVLMQNVGGGLISYGVQGYQLCNGAGNCVFLADTQSVTLTAGDTFSRRIPGTLPSGGELAVVFVDPEFTFTEAYVAWGSGAGADSFEPVVNETLRLWNTGERIQLEAGDTGFVCTGDTSRAGGYGSCNP